MTKVHMISADQSGRDMLQKRDALGFEIARLLHSVNEPVWFHDFKDPVGGAPVILLECSDAFLEQVKALPGVTDVSAPPSMLDTVRSDKIQKYFHSNGIPAPSLKKYTPRR